MMRSFLAKKLITRNLEALNRGDIRPTLRMEARDVHFRFPGTSSWGADIRGRDQVEAWLLRMVGTGLQHEADEVLASGPPWRMAMVLRGTDRFDDSQGTPVYENRSSSGREPGGASSMTTRRKIGSGREGFVDEDLFRRGTSVGQDQLHRGELAQPQAKPGGVQPAVEGVEQGAPGQPRRAQIEPRLGRPTRNVVDVQLLVGKGRLTHPAERHEGHGRPYCGTGSSYFPQIRITDPSRPWGSMGPSQHTSTKESPCIVLPSVAPQQRRPLLSPSPASAPAPPSPPAAPPRHRALPTRALATRALAPT